MNTFISIAALVISTFSAVVATVWNLARRDSLRREDIDNILSGVTDRIERLVDKIDKLTENSVRRDEFQKDLLSIREKVNAHVGNVNIHTGHSE